jgi:hypothetical protein
VGEGWNPWTHFPGSAPDNELSSELVYRIELLQRAVLGVGTKWVVESLVWHSCALGSLYHVGNAAFMCTIVTGAFIEEMNRSYFKVILWWNELANFFFVDGSSNGSFSKSTLLHLTANLEQKNRCFLFTAQMHRALHD